MLKQRKKWLVFLALLVLAAAFRIAVARWLPNDAPDDGRVYAQIARNILEQHVYSHATEPPYTPSLIRLPGYPLFLAAVYSIFGHTNNGSVRIIQALVDTGTCALVALLAFAWEPEEKRKRAAAIGALTLAAVCPFTTIYAATILTEVPTTFLALTICLAATLAFRAESSKRSLTWWLVAGSLGGLAVLFRPDSGLFVAAIGFTLVITGLLRIWSAPAERSGDGAFEAALAEKSRSSLRGVALRLPPHSRTSVLRLFATGAAFTLAFVLVLVPWTIRNGRVFHLFQPLAPGHGEMPGEFVPRGYNLWLRTWLDDERYVGPFLWALDAEPINLDQVPPQAFDSGDERTRVAALLDRYNHPQDSEPESATVAPPQPQVKASTAQPSSGPKTKQAASANENGAEDEEGNQSNEGDSEDESNQQESGSVEMTPEIDAGFAQIARERIAHHSFRFYVWLPFKRARTMWFDTHSQYWPFQGELLPLDELDYDKHQQFWLPLFAGLTCADSLLGLVGGWLLWSSGKLAARRWLLVVVLVILLRLIFFSSLENSEPRYVVEFFPFLSILGGITLARVSWTQKENAP